MPKFLSVAKSFGFKTTKLSNENNLDNKIKKILKSRNAVVCEIITQKCKNWFQEFKHK